MTLDVATVLAATGARPVRLGEDGVPTDGGLLTTDLVQGFSHVTVDSRTVHPDGLFVALPGSRVDGHDFVGAALSDHARGAIVMRMPDLGGRPTNGPRYLFHVDDSLTALQRLAAYWRRKHSAHVVGITGSVGKTTAKDVMAAVLATHCPVLSTEANLNTEIGLPLVLLRLTDEHRVAVLEMGMHVQGDIEELARIASPDTGVVTNVAPIHLERMGSVAAIAREKSRLVAALPPSGLAVLNADDPWTRAMAETSGVARPVLCGLSADAAYRATEVTPRGLAGVTFTVQAEGRALTVGSGIPGAHTVHALLYAAAVGRSLGMEWEAIEAALRAARVSSRLRVAQLSPSLNLIDDRYNASPLSMHAALDVLRESPGVRIAVLGDMLELGPDERAAHVEVGRYAAGSLDWLITRGSLARDIAEGARRTGLPADRIVSVQTNMEAVDALRRLLTRAADPSAAFTTIGRRRGHEGPAPVPATVLVKGSRGMRMEEIVQAIEGKAG